MTNTTHAHPSHAAPEYLRATPTRLANGLQRWRAISSDRTSLSVAIGLVAFLLFAIVEQLFPVGAVLALVRGDAVVADIVSLLFQLAVYSLLNLAFRRMADLIGSLRNEHSTLADLFQALRKENPSLAPTSGGLTGSLVKRLKANGAPTDPSERTALVDEFDLEMRRHTGGLSALQVPCLRIGILGTFLGLALAMLELGASGQTSLGPELFKALQSCFTTSIAGLVGSLAVLILSCRTERDAHSIRRGWRDLIAELAARGPEVGVVPASLDGIAATLRHVATSTVAQAAAIDAQTRAMHRGVAALNLEHDRIEEFLANAHKIRGVIVDEFAELRAEVSLTEWAEQTKGLLGEVVQTTTARIEKEANQAIGRVGRCAASLSDSRKHLDALGTRIERILADGATATAKPVAQLAQQMQTTIEDLQINIGRLSDSERAAANARNENVLHALRDVVLAIHQQLGDQSPKPDALEKAG